MAATLYTRERQVLDFITQFIQRYGFSPTLKEMCEGLGLRAAATAYEHLRNLERKGFIRLTSGKRRGIELVNKKIKAAVLKEETAQELPVLGFIAAGEPLEPHTDPNLYLSVASSLVPKGKPAYVLQVKGQSLIEEGILDGDYVVIQHQEDAQNGDIVVAILRSGLATLKRIFFENGRIKLAPANSQMSPIYVTEVKIQGKVIAVIRKF